MTASVQQPPRPEGRPNRTLWIVGGSAAGAVLLVVLLLVWGGSKESPTPPEPAMPKPASASKRPVISNPNAYNDMGHALLHEAARRGTPEDIRTLVEAGADVNLPAKTDGDTPLLVAIRARKSDNVRMLIKLRADVNQAETSGSSRTPLRLSCTYGQLEVVRMLLDAGADPNRGFQSEWSKSTPLSAAAGGGHLEVVKLLVERGATVPESRALHEAARGCHINVASYLLEKGEDVNERDELGTTAMVPAARGRHVAMVKFLIEKGAEPNAVQTGKYACTLLHWLANAPDTELAEIALAHGADVNARDSSGMTPVYVATKVRNVKIVEFLLTHGADPDIKCEGRTPLACALKDGLPSREIVDLLKKHGATEK